MKLEEKLQKVGKTWRTLENIVIAFLLITSLLLNFYQFGEIRRLSSERHQESEILTRIIEDLRTLPTVQLDESWKLLAGSQRGYGWIGGGWTGHVMYEIYTNGTHYAVRYGFIQIAGTSTVDELKKLFPDIEWSWTEPLSITYQQALLIDYKWNGKITLPLNFTRTEP